ncbi:MAG TPA: hypothetical protein VGD75_04085, partial [Bradyrhizobium sp.]
MIYALLFDVRPSATPIVVMRKTVADPLGSDMKMREPRARIGVTVCGNHHDRRDHNLRTLEQRVPGYLSLAYSDGFATDAARVGGQYHHRGFCTRAA